MKLRRTSPEELALTRSYEAPLSANSYDYLHDAALTGRHGEPITEAFDNPETIENFRTAISQDIARRTSLIHGRVSKADRLAIREEAYDAIEARIEAHCIRGLANEGIAATHPDYAAQLDDHLVTIWNWIDMDEVQWGGVRADDGTLEQTGEFYRLAHEFADVNDLHIDLNGEVKAGPEADQAYSERYMRYAQDDLAQLTAGSASRKRDIRRKIKEDMLNDAGYMGGTSREDILAYAQHVYAGHKLDYYRHTATVLRADAAYATLPADEQHRKINETLVCMDIAQFRTLEERRVLEMAHPKMGRFVGWFNKGKIHERMAKNAALGGALWALGGVSAGAFLTPLMGAAFVGFRFYRSYSSWQGRKNPASANLATDLAYYQNELNNNVDLQRDSMDDILSYAQDLSQATNESRATQERKERRKNVAIAAGMIMVPQLLRIDGVSDAFRSGWNHLPFHDNVENATGAVRRYSVKTAKSVGRTINRAWNSLPGSEQVENVVGKINPFDHDQHHQASGNTSGNKPVTGSSAAPNETRPPNIPDNSGNTVELPGNTGTGGNTPPAVTPSGNGGNVVVSPDRIDVPTPTVTAADQSVNLQEMSRLFGAHGAHPWNRAVEYFNGDTSGANQWLHMAVEKAGAHWHGTGTHAYIQLADGSTDTDAVWKALTEAMLS